KCQEYAYNANVLQIALELDRFNGQIDRAFNATVLMRTTSTTGMTSESRNTASTHMGRTAQG
ncbi:hypothetical protein AAVH_41671, partial [Aphelenchoides avenae]